VLKHWIPPVGMSAQSVLPSCPKSQSEETFVQGCW